MSGGRQRRARLAVFDIDGTLLQTTGIDEACFLGAFEEEFGIRHVERDWSLYPECTDPAIARVILARALGRPPRRDEERRVERRFVDLLEGAARRDAAACAEVPGARRLLERLGREPGWSAALATGAWSGSARCKLAVSGLDALDLPLATADDDPTRTGILRAAVARAAARDGGGFERVVAVGDGPWDVRAAADLGLAFVGVGCGRRAEALVQAGARHVVADLRPAGDLVDLLARAAPPAPLSPATA